jgi:hypothetical protein
MKLVTETIDQALKRGVTVERLETKGKAKRTPRTAKKAKRNRFMSVYLDQGRN